MLTLRLTFLWGRYYAHPWGLNPVRLREAEWPPSPWRLLRALAAGWFRAHGGRAPTVEFLALLVSLGEELPEIAVGPVAFSHTIHWQPNFGAADKDDKAAGTYKRTRHENHFAATASPVIFRWTNVALSEEQRSLLDAILSHISYLGRAESLCVVDSPRDGALPTEGWCRACSSNGRPIRRIAENCRDLFCPDPQDFQAADLWSRRAGRDRLDPNNAPPHLVEDLLSNQPLPDGARWVSYQMPEGWPGRWVVRTPKSSRKQTATSPTPRVARYLRFSLQCRIPIPLKFTVPLAEEFRKHALRYFGRANSFALSGHEPPDDIQGEHQQAFYLPLASNRIRFDLLDELHVWCPYGFTQAEVEALMHVGRLNWGGGKHPVRPVLLAIGKTVPDESTICIGQTSSRCWRSVTPFVPPRYFYRGNLHGAKLKAKDSPEQQLAQCLRHAGIDTACEIRRLTCNGSAQHFLPPMADWDIVRAPADDEDAYGVTVAAAVHVPSASAKSANGEKARRIGLFFEVSFDAPIRLPMPALGHSAHFGLGVFAPSSIAPSRAPSFATSRTTGTDLRRRT